MTTNAFDVYWKGDFQIILEDYHVIGTKLEKNRNGLKFLNRAFEIFYLCRRGIRNCHDLGMQKKMTAQLEDAATGATRRPRPLRGERHAEIRVVGGIS